ncbi:gamma-2-syntrophin isoform X4 [Puntigrus tetrazona]|uniref:gamma-2-syntrophin isoform X4 n=1 Tax=Puntigrus tetrazona TaxID=1606681 RepID=UPI001C89C596|nr:gamma-2-syntrophin isoform X4 [Puntigrus tetrazona]
MNAAAKHQPDLLERPASLLVPTWTKTGLALLYDEHTSNTYDVRLKLTKELLIIQKQDVVCVSGGDSHLNNCCTSKTADWRSRSEYQSQWHQRGEVYTRGSGSPGPSSDQSSRASSPLFDSGLHLNGNSSNTAPSSPSSPSANEPKYEKRWLDAVSLPLFMARISRRKAGTDKLRSNSFEVIALDGVCTHVLQFCTAAESTDWLQAISTNINDLTQESIKTANKYSSPDDQIVHTGWVCEHLQGGDVEPLHSCRFLALRGSSLLVFRSPPILASDWTQAEASFHLCEVLFKVHKLWIAEDCWIQTRFYMGLQQDGELRDSEPFCFSVLVGHGQSFCYSVELGSELVLWEKAFQRAVFMEVQRVRTKSYMCSSQGKILCFTLDFETGFSCSDSGSKKTIWKYKFSQLKGSSDDGKTRVKLLFQNSENKQIEMKELEFANLTAVLHCIHSFIAAKVATVDPVFVNNHSLTQKYMCSS